MSFLGSPETEINMFHYSVQQYYHKHYSDVIRITDLRQIKPFPTHHYLTKRGRNIYICVDTFMCEYMKYSGKDFTCISRKQERKLERKEGIVLFLNSDLNTKSVQD